LSAQHGTNLSHPTEKRSGKLPFAAEQVCKKYVKTPEMRQSTTLLLHRNTYSVIGRADSTRRRQLGSPARLLVGETKVNCRETNCRVLLYGCRPSGAQFRLDRSDAPTGVGGRGPGVHRRDAGSCHDYGRPGAAAMARVLWPFRRRRRSRDRHRQSWRLTHRGTGLGAAVRRAL
jgi:hypothetical protein